MKPHLTAKERAIIAAYVSWCKDANHEPDGRNIAKLLEKPDIAHLEAINDYVDEINSED